MKESARTWIGFLFGGLLGITGTIVFQLMFDTASNCPVSEISITIQDTQDYEFSPITTTSTVRQVFYPETITNALAKAVSTTTSSYTTSSTSTTTTPTSNAPPINVRASTTQKIETTSLSENKKHNKDHALWTYQCGNHPRQKKPVRHVIKSCDFEKLPEDYTTFFAIEVDDTCSSLINELWNPKSKVWQHNLALDDIFEFNIVSGVDNIADIVKPSDGTRRIKQRRTVDQPMTPSEISQDIDQRILYYRKHNYLATEIETFSPEAPFPDKFNCLERWDFIDQNSKCRVRYAEKTVWRKYTIFKSLIQKSVIAMTQNTCDNFQKNLQYFNITFQEI